MTPDQLLTATALGSWKQVTARLDKVFEPMSAEDLQRQVAPERNRIYYLLGHLTAANDRMLPMLSLGDRLHPELDEPFLLKPDKTLPDSATPEELKQAWLDVNAKLTAAFEKLSPGQWLERHTAVSEEDFAKEPLRNRLAVLLSRTNHLSFHFGQIALVK
jgi:hypothetical protein